jgi:inorganic phosphate transporter, PiT family
VGTVAALTALALYAFTNGFQDSPNALAGIVATRAARPGQALVLVSVCQFVGPLLFGGAVAATVAELVTVPADRIAAVLGAGVTAALVWNLFTWWWRMPASATHALVGGLMGSAVVDSGWDALDWGGLEGWRPVGLLGVLVVLAVSPIVGLVSSVVLTRAARLALRRGRSQIVEPVKRAQWFTAGALAFSNGTNDAQKVAGVAVALLVASGDLDDLSAPLWVRLAAAGAFTLGTVFGGWRVARTIGWRIYRLRPLDGLVAQASAASVVLGASAVGSPMSTSQVVTSAVVGTGVSRRVRHVRWDVVRSILAAWLVTLPAGALLGAGAVALWRALG